MNVELIPSFDCLRVAFIVACMYTGIGVFRLGWLMKFLGHPVIGGFMTGASLVIGMGQVKYVLGFKIAMGSSTKIQDYMYAYTANMNQFRWQEYIMGVTCIFIQVFFKVSLYVCMDGLFHYDMA